MTIYDLLCGLKNYVNIADFMKLKEEYFTKLLNLVNGTPFHDCFSDIFVAIDSKKLWEYSIYCISIHWENRIIN